jgi:predicted phage terminase large subunit-like protein
MLTNLQTIQKLQEIVENNPQQYQAVEDLFEMLRIYESEDEKQAHLWNKDVRRISAQQVKLVRSDSLAEKFYYLNKRSLLFDAKIDFDAYLQYIEFNREPEKRFYLPRRKQILPIVQAMQKLEDDKLDLLSISQPPGTGKTTLGMFFLSWIVGKYPMGANIASGHSGALTRSFYDRVNILITDPEYLWADVFPGVKKAYTNSKEEIIDLEKKKEFATLTCRSIDATLTGATRCNKYLYCDDLVSGIEEALSKDRLDNLWEKYTNDLKSRKKMGCKEIHIATRWSVHDVIGRLQEQYKDDPRAKFLSFPALNENEESNFDYMHGVGYDTKYFLDMRESLDDVSWKCLYMNEPIEREGLLFPEDELTTFNGTLPDGGLVAKYATCDVAWGGGDSLSMPIAYEYEDGSVYIVDVVFNKGDKTITRPIVVGKLKRHLPHRVQFEANNGGDEYCDAVDAELRKANIRLHLTHKKAPSTSSKLSRIIQASPDIKKFIFLDKKHRSKEYVAFMKELTSFIQTGKNKHDDAPDSLAMLATMIGRRYGKVTAIKRPF